MPKYSTAFGMDVHLRSTTVCALDADTGEAVTRRFPGNPWGAYESGYLGFAPQRELAGLGVECVVTAVSKIPRSAADSASKNDRNDAARMAKAILAHDISPVWVPSPEVEGIRDLAGAYDGATARLATAKQRLLAFLAKRGFVYGGTTPAGNPRKYWTYDFLRWLDKVRPEDDGGVRTLAALRNEVEAAAEARADLLSEYRATVDAGPIAAEVAALQSIKGCAFALAAAFSAEVGDFTRFDSPDKLLAYAGMSPSTYQSGQLKNCYPHMEKRGSRYLRYALYNATKYVCHWDPTFADYLAKKRAEGKHYNVALSHAAKKLVRLIFAMEKSGMPYRLAA